MSTLKAFQKNKPSKTFQLHSNSTLKTTYSAVGFFKVNSIESQSSMETSTVVCTEHHNGRCGNRCEHKVGDAFHYHTHFWNLFRKAPCCHHQKGDYKRKNKDIHANSGGHVPGEGLQKRHKLLMLQLPVMVTVEFLSPPKSIHCNMHLMMEYST